MESSGRKRRASFCARAGSIDKRPIGVGDVATSDVLDELERLLLDVAHGTTPNDALKSRIEEQDVLFKIRVLQTSVRARKEQLAPQRF